MKGIIVILKIFLGLAGLTLVFQGFMWAFFPDSNLEINQIIADSTLGMNMIKSDIGGALLATGVIILLFTIKGRQWFYPTIILSGGYFLVRTISFFVDGYHLTIIIGIAMEGIVILAAYFLNRLLIQSSK